MAATAPPPNISKTWVDPGQIGSSGLLESKGTGFGMSGMSLMPSFGGTDFRTGDTEEGSRIVDSSDSVHSMRSSNGSPIPSTGMHLKVGISRPPGLGGIAVPSPFGKPGHSYTSSTSTAQNLTLTPTSSLDGGDIYVRQSSPFHGDGPSIMSSDYSRGRVDDNEIPPGFGSLASSFDTEDGEHDGLLGLQALRDRAQSSPGPMVHYSSSPPVRGQPGYDDGRPMRPRAVSRDNGRSQSNASHASRPPLSGGSGLSPHTTESKSYFPGTGSRSRDHSPTPPGVISRPGNYQNDPAVYDPSRRRSLGPAEGGREYIQPLYNDRNSVDHLAHKFGQMGGQPQMMSGSQPPSFRQGQHGFQRHQRASSLPGPMRAAGGQDEPYQEEIVHNATRRGSDYGVGMSSGAYHPPDNDYSDPRYNQYGQDPMMRPQMIAQRRTSLQTIPGSNPGYYVQSHNVHRRESLDFVPGHNRYPDGVPIVASNEEMRMYMNADDRNPYRNDRMVSPGHSPLHTHYSSGHHSSLSSSPASMNSGSVQRGNYGHEIYSDYGGNAPRGRHRATHSDDDLSHPLVGEHIDDYGEYPPSDILEAPGFIPPVRGRAVSADQPLPHYGGAASAHVLPTAGSALPMPKVVYNIKFKRTQRTFVLGPRLNRDLKIGTYVKVEADRGEDLGIVVGKVPSEKVMSSRPPAFRGGMDQMGAIPPQSGMAPPAGASDLKRIIRLATHDEVSLLNMKREEEEELLKICRAKVRQRALPMNVVDAEYQFDRHKLTFFFEAEGRVDFRELVRDLFSMYKTRIWMQQLDKSTAATCPAAPDEPQSVVLDYGTPIIAPESEYSEFASGVSGDTTD